MIRLFFTLLISTCLIQNTFAANPESHDSKSTESLRVISLAPNLTEFMVSLNGGVQLVGITDFYATYPTGTEVQLLGGYNDPNKELIVSLEPDLVLTLPSERSLEKHLIELGLNVMTLECDSIDEIKMSFLQVANAVGESSQAEKIIQQFDEDWKLQSLPNSEKDKPEILLVLNHPSAVSSAIYGVGPGTFLDELITQLGGNNWLADSPQIYPTVNRETLTANPPDIIIEVNIEDFRHRKVAQIEDYWREYLTTDVYNDLTLIIQFDKKLSIPAMHLGESVQKLREQLKLKKELKTFSLSP